MRALAFPEYTSSNMNIRPSGLWRTQGGKSVNLYSAGGSIGKTKSNNLKWALGSQSKYKSNNDIHEFSKIGPTGNSNSANMNFQSLFRMPSTVVTFPATRLLMNLARTRSGNTKDYFGLTGDVESIICSAAVQKLGTEQLFESMSSVWTGIYDLRNDLGTAFDMTLDVVGAIADGSLASSAISTATVDMPSTVGLSANSFDARALSLEGDLRDLGVGAFNAGSFDDFMLQDTGIMQMSTGGSFVGDGFSNATSDSFGSTSNGGQVRLVRITRTTSSGTGARQVNNVGFVSEGQNSDRGTPARHGSGDQMGGSSYGQRF